MTDSAEQDIENLSQAFQRIKKTLECSLCHQLPTVTETAKCGHPFCKTCVDKVLHTKKAICSICRTVIIRSAIRRVEPIDKIVEDFKSLCKAAEKDSNTNICLDKQQATRQSQRKSNSLTLPGPSKIKTVFDASSWSELSSEKPNKRDNSKGPKTAKLYRKKSIDSEETIKIHKKKVTEKSKGLTLGEQSTFKAADSNCEPVFTEDNLSGKIETLGSKEKVEGWLNTEKFEDESEEEEKITEILKPPNSNASSTTEILESFSQNVLNLGGSLMGGRNSQASNTTNKKARHLESPNTSHNSRKYESFTFEATDNKKKRTNSRPISSAEKIFENLRRETIDEQNEHKKSKILSASTDSSWKEVKKLKKETHSKIRKRKRLNISIERPTAARLALETSDSEEEKEAGDTSRVANEKNKSTELNEGNEADNLPPSKKREKPNVLSSITLGVDEMVNIQALNRRQVREIIGVHNASKNSSNSADKSSIKSNKNPTPRKSREHSRDNTNEEESTSHIETSLRPQSKQSNHPNDSRPDSRLSIKSTGRPAPEKFRLSTRKISSTSNTGPLEVSEHSNTAQDQPKQEVQERMILGNDSPVRTSNDIIRNKLSLKRLSDGNNQTITREKKSTIVSIKKLGRLCKPSNKIKFSFLGSTMKSVGKNSLITTRNASTQTVHSLANSDVISNSTKHMSSESIGRIIIPGTRTASTASSDSRLFEQTETRAVTAPNKTMAPNKSPDELDTVNKVNMLSPDKDSQLKYLATKSPSVPRIESMDSDEKQRHRKPCTVMKETSFINSDSATWRLHKHSRAVITNAEKLIATDSEDQDMPDENLQKIKRRHKHRAGKDEQDKVTNSATTSSVSKTTSTSSDVRIDGRIETVITNADKSPSVHSVGSNLKETSPRVSPRRKRDRSGSQTKRRSTEKLKSLSKTSDCLKQSTQSDSKNVPVEKAKNTEATQPLEDSDTSGIISRHKVVRKLRYTQEPKTESEKSEHSDKAKSKRTIEPKTFQRILRIPSSDSESESLEISLTTKKSSSMSQNIARPEAFREVNKSPLLSEDMTIVFSSDKDTQESKRKRSPSPNSLDNNDLQAIASNWCADLDRSSEEITVAGTILELAEKPCLDGVLLKKPRVEIQDLPGDDTFHALKSSAICGSKRKSNESAETAIEINHQSLNNEENRLLLDLEDVAEQFDSIDENISIGNNFVPKNDTKHVTLTGGIECSIKRGNTFNGMVTTSNNSSIPTKAKSLADRDLTSIDRQSQNSDKENEATDQRVKKRVENEKVLTNKGQKISSNYNEDLNELQSNCNVSKSNAKSFPSRNNSMSNTELFESSFDRDCLNITQEVMLMEEVANNLLGRKSNQEKARKSPVKISGKIFTTKESSVDNANQMTKGRQITQIDTDDSGTMDEDIVESTPEKNLPLKKESHANVECSQKFNASMKSFMSLDITPIHKGVPRSLQLESDSSKTPSCNQTVIKNLGTRSSRHSTPKSTSSILRKSQLSETKSNCSTETKTNQKRRLSFVCSCLTLSQIQTVKSFAKSNNAEYSASYTPDITHVIVETNERNAASRTLKYMLGIAYKKWIVSYRWVTDSINENRILEEESYEAVDSDTEEPGPRRSRLSKKGLFDEFAFLCMEPFSDISTSQLQDLLLSTGGTVYQTLEELACVVNKHKIIVYNCETHEQGVLETWRKKGRALPVQVDWVLSCISQYDLVSFRYYLQNVDVLSDFDFPPELIAEDEEEEEEDS